MSMLSGEPHVSDREISITRVFDAPRELVFQMWTDPRHVGRWWGPRGFTTVTYSMDVRPGGVWRFCMHGPDGRDYQNRVRYLEVERPSRLVYQHDGEEVGAEPVDFKVSVEFEDEAGTPGRTRVSMRMVFPSHGALRRVAETYGAVEGLRDTIARLGEHLSDKARGRAPEDPAVPAHDFIISRTFDAPRDLVFKVWTQREHLAKWWGPKGASIAQASLDMHPGGSFHYRMAMPPEYGVGEMWGKWLIREISPPDRLVFVNTFSDAAGGLTRHPLAPDWPRETLTTVTFADHHGRTLVTVRWTPVITSEKEREVFEQGRPSMTKGWSGTFDQLAQHLRAGPA